MPTTSNRGEARPVTPAALGRTQGRVFLATQENLTTSATDNANALASQIGLGNGEGRHRRLQRDGVPLLTGRATNPNSGLSYYHVHLL